jgi:hypothetical protein
MQAIKNFFNAVFEIIIETRRLKAEYHARKYSKV